MEPTRVLYNDTCPVCSFEIDAYRRRAEAADLPIRFDTLTDAASWGLTPDQAVPLSLILTEALITDLAAQGHVLAASATALGIVKTGIAVKGGQPLPAVGSAKALTDLLLSAQGIYFPDPQKATAGIHFMKVLRSLGLDQRLASRLCVC